MADDTNPYAATVTQLYGPAADPSAEPQPEGQVRDMDGTDVSAAARAGNAIRVREPTQAELEAQGLDEPYTNPKTGKVSPGVSVPDDEQTPAPAPSDNPYAATVARLYPKDDEADDTTSKWMAWRARNPQMAAGQAADVLRYAEASGKPVDFVAKNLDAVRGSVDASKVDLAGLADTHPALHQWLGTQGLRVDAAKDDLGPLTQLEDAIHAPHVGEAFRDALREQILNYHEVQDYLGNGSGERTQRIEQLEKQLAGAEKDYGSTSFMGHTLVATAKMLPMVVGDLIARAGGTALAQELGMGAPAAAELALGGPENPLADATAGGAEVAGKFASLVAPEIASGGYNAYQMLGPIHRELQQVRGPNGEKLDPDIEHALAGGGALLGGAVTGALGGPTGKMAGKALGGTTVKELADRGMVGALSAELKKEGVIPMLNRLVRRFGAHELAGAVTMALQSAATSTTEQVGASLANGTFDGSRVAKDSAHAFIQGLEDMPLMAAAHAVGETRADERDRASSPMRAALEEKGQQVASAQGQDRLQALIGAAKASKSAEAMPAEVRELVKGSAEHPAAVDTAYIHRDAFDRLAQASKLDPAELARAVFGSSDPYTKSTEGGDLAVPIEDYVDAVKDHGPVIDQLAKEDTRLNQPDRSPREQREVTEGLQKRAAELAKAVPEDMADEQRQVYEDFRGKAEAAGRDGKEADANARLVAAAMQSWAERFQKNGSKATALDLYRMQDVGITGPRGQGGEAPLIQELRKRYGALPEDDETRTNPATGKQELVTGKKSSLYIDRLTGLYNQRGYEARAPDAARPYTTEVQVAQGKSINDKLGHDAGDNVLKVFGNVLKGEGITDAVRRGNTVSFDHSTPEAGDAIVRKMKEALGHDQVVTSGTVRAQDGESADDRLQRAQYAHEDRRAAGREKGVVPERDAPLSEAALKGLEPHLAAAERPATATVTPAHEADFERLARDRDLFTEANLTPEGLLNENGFRLAVDHAQDLAKELRAKGIQAQVHFLSADVRGVSKLNAEFSKGLAREDRLKPVDEIMSEAAKHIANDKRARRFMIARPHGDEFYAVHVGDLDALDDLKSFFFHVDKEAAKSAFYRPVADEVVLLRGLRLAFGTGETFKKADREALPDAKDQQKDLIEPERIPIADWRRAARDLTRRTGHEPRRVGQGLREEAGGGPGPDGRTPEGGEGGAGGGGERPPDGSGRVGGLGGEEAGGAAGQRADDDHASAAGEVAPSFEGEPLFVAPGVEVHFSAEVPTEPAMAAAEAYAGTLRSPERRAAVLGYLKRVREFLAGRKMQSVAGDLPRDLDVQLADRFGIVDPKYGFSTTDELQHRSRGGERGPGRGDTAYDRAVRADRREQFDKFARSKPPQYNLDQPAFHGSPHDFDKFSLHKIGTGEGHQSYGWGLYFAGRKALADHYRETLSAEAEAKDPAARAARSRLSAALKADDNLGFDSSALAVNALLQHPDWASRWDVQDPKEIEVALGDLKAAIGRLKKGGQLYKVDVPDDSELLDYDKPLSEQPEKVRAALESIASAIGGKRLADSLSHPQSTGKDFYQVLSGLHGNERAMGGPVARDAKSPSEFASRTLRDAGIPGLRYLDGQSRSAGEGSHNYVIWDDGRVQVKDKYYQPTFELESKRGRGSITFTPPEGGKRRRFDIELLRGADHSTLAHETAHFLGEVMGDLAQRPDAPAELKDDYAGLLKFMGYDSHEQRQAGRVERGQLKNATGAADKRRLTELTAKEEKLSHAWEQYLMEGKTPSVALAGTFARFRNWMVQIYRNVRSLQGGFVKNFGESIGLTDDVRGIFDRLLASTDEVERMQKAQAAQPFREPFADASPEERAAAEKQWASAQDEASSEVLRLVTAEDKKESGPYFKAELQRFRDEVNGELDNHPVYRAIKALQEGKEKLDRAGATKELGAEFVADIAKKHPGVFAKKGEPAAQLEVAAGLHGFESGGDMLRAMQAAEPRRALVESQATERLRNLYGPTLLENAKALDEVALAALHNPEAMRAALMEHRRLAEKLDPAQARKLPAVDEETLRRHAKRLVAQLPVGRIIAGDEGAAGGYRRAERVAAERMRKAYEEGKIDQAVGFNLDRLLSMALWREARDARERLERDTELLRQSSRAAWQEALGKADVAASGEEGSDRVYRSAHNAMLEAVGFIEPSAAGPDPRALDALADAAGKNSQELGFDLDGIRDLIADPKKWKDLSQAAAQNVVDAAKSIRRAANTQNSIAYEGKRLAIDTFFEKNDAELAGTPETWAQRRDRAEKAGLLPRAAAPVKWLDANLMRMETLIDVLTGGNKDSVLHKQVIDGQLACRAAKEKLGHEYLRAIEEKWEKLPPAMKKSLDEVVDLSDLPMPESVIKAGNFARDGKATRRYAMMIAFNVGNESNLERLLGGYDWNKEQVTAALDRVLTKEHWDFVQGVWDTFETLYPHIARVEERETGVAPGKIEAAPVVTKHGTYRGGYFPAKYDPRSPSKVAQWQEQSAIERAMSPSYKPAATAKGHAKARAEHFQDVVNLDWNVVPSHVANVLHDVAYRPWVKDTARIFADGRLRSQIQTHLGEPYVAQLDPWLKSIANSQDAAVSQNMRPAVKALGMMRGKIAMQALGLNLPVAMQHLPYTLTLPLTGEVKPGLMAKAVAQAMTGWGQQRTFALENSQELAFRADQVGTKLRQAFDEMGSKTTRVDRFIAEHAFVALEWFEKITTTPAWTARYQQELGAGVPHEEAVRAADKMIRTYYLPKSKAETPGLFRDKGVGGMFMFQGFMNTMYNVQRPWARDLHAAFADEDRSFASKAGAAAKFGGKVLALALTQGALGEWLGGKGQEDDESFMAYLFRKVLTFEAGGALPGTGALIDSLVLGKQVSVRQSPGLAIADGVAKAVEKMVKESEDGDYDALAADIAKGLGLTAAFAAGVPLHPFTTAGRYLQSDSDPRGSLDQAGGLLYGQPKGNPSNPATAAQTLVSGRR